MTSIIISAFINDTVNDDTPIRVSFIGRCQVFILLSISLRLDDILYNYKGMELHL
jgi:hypothetical protein